MILSVPRVLLVVSFLALALTTAGCQGSGTVIVEEEPQARSTSSRGFNPRAYEKIAVLVKDNTDGYYRRRSGARRQVENVFTQAAAKRGYQLATRSQVEAIKDEIRFEDTGWTEQNPTEPGHLYNVSALLIVNINESYVEEEASLASRAPEPERDNFFGRLLDSFLDSTPEEVNYATANVSADLISVREGKVLWNGYSSGSVEIGEDEPKEEAIPVVSEVVAAALPTR
jgi:hypothetical protein